MPGKPDKPHRGVGPHGTPAWRSQGRRDRLRVVGKERGMGPKRPPSDDNLRLLDKPYGFVSLPDDLTFGAGEPVWHDGTGSHGRLSGEIRFELVTLTPLLVGWEQGKAKDKEHDWPVPGEIPEAGQLASDKPVLCPLRAPWGKRPVIIPGDSLKGLLRHELGALLGTPMERVAERSYSYRPNARYPDNPKGRFLVPRLAQVLDGHVETRLLDDKDDKIEVRVPTRLALYPDDLQYNKNAKRFDYLFDRNGGAPYRGGMGAGKNLNAKRRVHTSLTLLREARTEIVDVPAEAIAGYLATVRHLVDVECGHFSSRHPDVPKTLSEDVARNRIRRAAREEVFQPGDFVWVEWDVEKKRIVSFGWHYYYRWAYVDTVRQDADAPGKKRRGLFPLDEELRKDGNGAPMMLSAVRRLFGYLGDSSNPGSKGIGQGDHAQLMGRLFVNSALEVVGEEEPEEERFLKPTFLRELGMPRPSAVEHYLKQNVDAKGNLQRRPSDRATLVTYGDAAGYDRPGELAGRKFYLDRKDAYLGEPWKYPDGSDADRDNRRNTRSVLALEASRPGRRFRFTVRFRDLDPSELAAVIVALCPDQFREVLGGSHPAGYCSKLGYARPLGWGSVRIEASQLLLLDEAGDVPHLKPESDLVAWVAQHHRKTPTQEEWLAIHRRHHPNAADYPRDSKGHIHTYHAKLRAEHAFNRRYRNR